MHSLLPAVLAPMLAMLATSAMVEPSQGSPALGSVRLPYADLDEPPPLLIRPLSKAAALDLNRAIPFSRENNVPAAPFQFKGDKEVRDRALECLTSAVYYEAGSEDPTGQQAVAQVILNRVRHPAFPASICAVVFQGSTRETGCQFTFTCDGSLMRMANANGWARARKIAEAALSGAVDAAVGLSTHYHADYVVPYWATSLDKNAQVGAHIFYRWPNGWGKLAAFHQKYSRKELDPSELRVVALMADDLWPKRSASSATKVIEVAADPTVELLGIIALLARAPEPRGSQYEQDIATHFASQADHLAVKLFRDAQAGIRASSPSASGIAAQYALPASLALQEGARPVAAPGTATNRGLFVAALGDFAHKSNLEGFFRGHRSFYNKASGQAAGAFAQAAGDWQMYTRLPLEGRKVVLALALENASGCVPRGVSLPELSLLWPPSSQGVGASDILVNSGLAQDILTDRKKGTVPGGVQETLVRAVFQRIDALSNGAAGIRPAINGASTDDLLSIFVTRLRIYEQHRDRYPTLSDFLPTLLAGVKLTGDAANGAKASGQTRLQRCEVRPMVVN